MPPREAPPKFIDLNILPEQYRPRRLPRRVIILWAVVVGLALLLPPFYIVFASMRGDVARLEADLSRAQNELQALGTPVPEIVELTDTLSRTVAMASRVEEAYPTIVASRIDWSGVMAAIGNYDPAQISLTSIEQADSQITLEGKGVNQFVVSAYADTLRASPLFSSVDLQYVGEAETPFATPTSTGTPTIALTPTPTGTPPTATPTSTATPTHTPTPTPSPTFTPTPDPRDEYEPDDFRAQAIALGEPQMHNFYPLHDIDRVRFLAKRGRRYQVSTSGLAPGVDTRLNVYVAGITYSNDDRAPGDLSSLVEFQAPGYDAQVYVMVTNRGQYGPDQWYAITVQEVVVTPTPTLTPTPELGDEYEPDGLVPKPISVGEMQTHNFYPEGDVDKVQFRVKKDRLYEVSTSNLALGVDTKIAVTVGVRDYVNDDVAPGFRASRVLFQAEADGPAVVSIVNLDRYGPDKTYEISVAELEPTATPTPLPTGTPTPTPELRDGYEPDDTDPKPIGVGKTQTHNFYPNGDVDKATFGVKSGHLYALTTSNLAPGVDTEIRVEVRVGPPDVTYYYYANDDMADLLLESEVRFILRFPPTKPAVAVATISNVKGGQYGADKTYDLTLSLLSCDVYEPDDTDPQPIGVAETQPYHSFYPSGDIDKVTFGVKSGRLYALTTSNLVPGVDTEIRVEVKVDDEVYYYANDDMADRFLESQVRFIIPERGGTAVGIISNVKDGQYGADKTYDLTLSMLSSLVDVYEPDDPFAKPIAVEGTQEHTFYPEGDRDLVKFIAKEGRYYAVHTSNLAWGVDTSIKVVLEGQIMGENDDYAPGTGNFASAVCFQAPIDGTTVVLITNLEQQYGVDKTYEINVNEAPILQVMPLSLPFPPVVEGGEAPPAQEVYINNIGGGILTWTAAKDAFWLNISPSSGTAPSVMSVSVDITGLTAGTYIGYIEITGTSLCTQNSPQTVIVTLQVIAPTPTPVPTPTPIPPTATPTPTSSSSWKPPGMAFPAAEAVDFVIVLELKMGSP